MRGLIGALCMNMLSHCSVKAAVPRNDLCCCWKRLYMCIMFVRLWRYICGCVCAVALVDSIRGD